MVHPTPGTGGGRRTNETISGLQDCMEENEGQHTVFFASHHPAVFILSFTKLHQRSHSAKQRSLILPTVWTQKTLFFLTSQFFGNPKLGIQKTNMSFAYDSIFPCARGARVHVNANIMPAMFAPLGVVSDSDHEFVVRVSGAASVPGQHPPMQRRFARCFDTLILTDSRSPGDSQFIPITST